VVTAVEEAVESSIEPRDFLTTPDGGPYCVKGTVGPQYEDVVILGMELAGDPATADCTAKPLGMAVGERPTVMPTGDGIAVNFVKGGGSGGGGDTGFTWRVQIEGANGSSDENERWCATVTETQGKVFIPYEKFDTQCWYVNADGTKAADYAGAPYTKGTPIAAVSFLVPGTLDSETPFEFCVNGFAPGTSAADAPDGSAVAGDITGTVGDDSADGDYRRVKVTADGHDYIIQNNNWGNESGELVLTYKNNSFQITAGSGNGGDAPASFPSIFIGNNGNTMNGAYSTKPGDKLPIQISSINKIDTHFKWSGSTSVFNATYDVWFASSPPNGRYNDGLNGFVMVWTHAPGGGKQPIGSDIADATIEGHNWDVWVGPRGQGPGGEADLTPDSQAAVVSYVTKDGDINDFQFDLKKFIDNAVGRSGNGSKTFDGSLYLTDVFAGFEIWSGGSGGNLGVDEFTCVVNP
jgi:hypothetical protein